MSTRVMLATSMSALAMAASACCSTPSPSVAPAPTHEEPTMPETSRDAHVTPAPTWSVWDGDARILTIIGRPGPLISTAPPPPGPAAWVTHPFLSATAESAFHEDRLRTLLEASSSVDDYLRRLREAGFVVREEAPTP